MTETNKKAVKKVVVKKRGAVKKYSSLRARELARNKRRNERRRKDKTYRLYLQKQARENRRRKQGLVDCSHVIETDKDKLMLMGTLNVITDGINAGETHVTYDVKQVSSILGGGDRQKIYRWINQELVPEMKNKVKSEITNNKGTYRYSKVYTFNELKHLCRVLRMHQKNTSCNFSKDHLDTINFIKNAVSKERGEG